MRLLNEHLFDVGLTGRNTVRSYRALRGNSMIRERLTYAGIGGW